MTRRKNPADASGSRDRHEEFLVARAIHEALRREKSRRGKGYVDAGPIGPHRVTLIDGEFHLMAVARSVLKALAEEKNSILSP